MISPGTLHTVSSIIHQIGMVFLTGQDFRAVFCYGHGVLEVGAVAAVVGHGGPSILQDVDSGPAGVDHRFDCQHHPGLQPGAFAGVAEVRHLWVFVHAAANAVTNKLADHAKSLSFADPLHRGGDITQPSARLALPNGLLERMPGHVEQPPNAIGDLADGIRDGGVRIVSVDNHAAVDRDDVAVLQDALRIWHPMYDLLVDRGAERRWVAVIAFERRLCAKIVNSLDSHLFEVHRRNAGGDMLRDGVVYLPEGLT